MSEPIEPKAPTSRPTAPKPSKIDKRGNEYKEISCRVAVYTDKSRRNRFRLNIKGELTAHSDIKSITEEIAYYVETLAK